MLGNPLVPGMAGPMLHWLGSHEPAVLRAAAWALQPKDWLRMRLVGRAGSEPSDASGTLLYDMFENTWALPVVEALGLPARLLAPLGSSDDVAGRLDVSIANELGLPGGIPVAFGAADTAAALVGTGLLEKGPVQLTVGSGAQIVTLREQPDPDPGLRHHVFASAFPGLWYAMAAVQAAGVALSWALKAFDATWEEAYELFDAPPGRGAEAPCSSRTWPGPGRLRWTYPPGRDSSTLTLVMAGPTCPALSSKASPFPLPRQPPPSRNSPTPQPSILREAAAFIRRGASSSVTCWARGC